MSTDQRPRRPDFWLTAAIAVYIVNVIGWMAYFIVKGS